MEKLEKICANIDTENDETRRDMMLKCAGTSLNSKLLSNYK